MQTAIERIFPLVYEFRKERTAEDEINWQAKRAKRAANVDIPTPKKHQGDPMDLVTLSDDDRNVDSDQSWE